MTAKEMSRVPTYTHGGRGSSPGPSSFLGVETSVEKRLNCCSCRGNRILGRLPRMVVNGNLEVGKLYGEFEPNEFERTARLVRRRYRRISLGPQVTIK